MIDTNVIISAIYNPVSTPARVLNSVCKDKSLVLCDHIVAECYDVVKRRFPQHISTLDKLLTSLGYEMVVSPREANNLIDDPKDSPILNAAILADVDVIISGDKHFLRLDIERPKIMTPTAYLEENIDI
jgi:putative PIN family toxin of toxin-antitoxin system